MSKVYQIYNFRSRKVLDQPEGVYVGIECEIESVRNKDDFDPRDFKATSDNSLRNNGVEFISQVLKPPRLLESFRLLHEDLEFYDSDDAFSPRTSTHIHLNCRFMEEEQVRQMLFLYTLFERYFFLMVDSSREDNIHCVPLVQTTMSKSYSTSMDAIVSRWHKYTAFNLLPLRTQGSIEFRHLQGTDDDVLLEKWLACIVNLQDLSLKCPVNKESICDAATRKEWLVYIFGHIPNLLQLNMDTLTADELLDTKLAFL